mmetsp:Transcript_6791/g.41453  ORF Transcript_6791/g.41453 Transcript_6791/m.41453 type:complete len:204 (-) Transcript_6791:836-1447(-)
MILTFTSTLLISCVRPCTTLFQLLPRASAVKDHLFGVTSSVVRIKAPPTLSLANVYPANQNGRENAAKNSGAPAVSAEYVQKKVKEFHATANSPVPTFSPFSPAGGISIRRLPGVLFRTHLVPAGGLLALNGWPRTGSWLSTESRFSFHEELETVDKGSRLRMRSASSAFCMRSSATGSSIPSSSKERRDPTVTLLKSILRRS